MFVLHTIINKKRSESGEPIHAYIQKAIENIEIEGLIPRDVERIDEFTWFIPSVESLSFIAFLSAEIGIKAFDYMEFKVKGLQSK